MQGKWQRITTPTDYCYGTPRTPSVSGGGGGAGQGHQQQQPARNQEKTEQKIRATDRWTKPTALHQCSIIARTAVSSSCTAPRGCSAARGFAQSGPSPPPPKKNIAAIHTQTHKVPKFAPQAVLGRMQPTLHATRRTPHGAASRLVQAISAWPMKTRRAPARAGIVGMLGAVVMRLRPCETKSTRPRAHQLRQVYYTRSCTAVRRFPPSPAVRMTRNGKLPT